MSVRHLHKLFEPRSIAIIGASIHHNTIGGIVLRNVIESGFKGAIYPVNPKYTHIDGLQTYSKLALLPSAPDLAVICTPPSTIPGLISALGELGGKAAIVLTAGLSAAHSSDGVSILDQMLAAAKPHLIRVLGPNCVGLLVPAIGLNASFSHTNALVGKIAFVSQSGALVTAMLDWANARHIGFSKFISLGDSADVDFGDVLDFLASDADTQSILLYVEDIRNARKFLSAARAAARSKPIVVVKAGRFSEGAKAAASHTGALAGSDKVYDAVIRRAGMVRVFTTDDLFSAVETLAHAKPLFGDRLAIFTNGGGPGVLATDALIDCGGLLASLSQQTCEQLKLMLPGIWSGQNPVDIIGDAPAERYRATLDILLADKNTDALLLIQAPTAIVPGIDIAKAILPSIQASSRNVLTCWLGGDAAAPAREFFSHAGIPTYGTPEEAIHGFMQLVDYHRNQTLLMQVPPSVPNDFIPDRTVVATLLRRVQAECRTTLSEPEAKQLFAAYGIPVVDTRIAESDEQAVLAAQAIGFPIALKVLSSAISHKTDVGGVVLDLESADAVRIAAKVIRTRVHALRPDALIHGFSVQAMARHQDAVELIIGVTVDPVFGPVILFGQGGVAVELLDDTAIGLPPLDMLLAREMISRTRVKKLLSGYRNKPAANTDAICRSLIQIAHLVTDFPEIIAIDINPLIADARSVIALDGRVQIMSMASGTAQRTAILPYPTEFEEWVTWQGQPLLLRPIKPEDGQAHVNFFKALDPVDIRYRVFIAMRELQPSQLARLTQIDYDREIALIATRSNRSGVAETLGVIRAVGDPDNEQAEFAITIRSDLKGQGLGTMLMTKLIADCRRRKTRELIGYVLTENCAMRALALRFGFESKLIQGEAMSLLSLKLDQS